MDERIGFWKFALRAKNHYMMIFMLMVGLLATVQGVIIEGELYPLWMWLGLGIALFYNWWCWREFRRGGGS